MSARGPLNVQIGPWVGAENMVLAAYLLDHSVRGYLHSPISNMKYFWSPLINIYDVETLFVDLSNLYRCHLFLFKL